MRKGMSGYSRPSAEEICSRLICKPSCGAEFSVQSRSFCFEAISAPIPYGAYRQKKWGCHHGAGDSPWALTQAAFVDYSIATATM